MTSDVAAQRQLETPVEFEHDPTERPPWRTVITERPVVKGIIDVTMVGLVGGSPRLAVRAARLMIEENRGSRSDHGGRVRRRVRRGSRIGGGV